MGFNLLHLLQAEAEACTRPVGPDPKSRLSPSSSATKQVSTPQPNTLRDT